MTSGAIALNTSSSKSELTPERIKLLLQESIDPSRILIREIERIALASDASFYRLIPKAVIQPLNTAEIKVLFEFSHQMNIPLTFRAAGTSLSGQAITDGILVEIGRHWVGSHVRDNGKAIAVQPGLIGQHANDALKLYRAKIGPDPASISSARMGGILANNASGMCCGVVQNAYHTLRSLTFLLPSGTEIDTASPDADRLFREKEPELASGILRLKNKIESNPPLARRIREKYRMKNTTGYGLNAFLDFDRPVDIFSRLLIGSEGTLAFIAQAVLETLVDLPFKYTGLLLFPDLFTACAAIVPLRDAGAAALELMDRASLRSVENQPGISPQIKTLPDGAAALLVEFHAPSESLSTINESDAAKALAGLSLLAPPVFTRNASEQAALWKIRKGMFPSVGAVRASETTVVIEDVAFPVERLAAAATDLRELLDKHGYPSAIIFGHAKDGNLHFVLTQGFTTQSKIDQYSNFIDDLVNLVVKRYDGALKAEHGTGRNMAPFVETEWGADAYEVMCELKALADPHNLLNPGVIINPDPRAHLAGLKRMPVVEPEVDKCIECGFCEVKCPSRDITLTPRQRIVVRRELERLKISGADPASYESLQRDFPYMALHTCAVDGLCATDCPVGINTGNLTKRFRQARHSPAANSIAVHIARNFKLMEYGARFALGMGHLVQNTFGLAAMTGITKLLDKLQRSLLDEPFWQWSKEMPHPRRGALLKRPAEGAAAVYFPACISRMMGALPGEPNETSVMQAFLNVADRAGVRLHVPADIEGNCCGVPFSSKGFEDALNLSVNRTIAQFWTWSNHGEIPIVIDTSPCTYGLKTAREHLSPENQTKFDQLKILDSVEFVHDYLLPKLQFRRKAQSVALHPVCSATKMAIVPKLARIAEAASENVLLPHDAGCCAFAGDRGFLFPELTASATTSEATEVNRQQYDGYFSSSRTCEIGMTSATGKVYRSYLHLLDSATRP